MEICIYLHPIKMIFVHGKKYEYLKEFEASRRASEGERLNSVTSVKEFVKKLKYFYS